MTLSCYCILLIIGDDLDFKAIENNIGISPSTTIVKGTLDYEGNPIKSDTWVYEDNSSYAEPQQALEELINVLRPSANFLTDLAKLNTVTIRCSINSDLAQVGFDFSSQIFREISNYVSRYEFSILSWGEVVDEGSEERRAITDMFPRIIAKHINKKSQSSHISDK